MQLRSISAVHFGASQYVSYNNVPESLQVNEPVLTQLAKDNVVSLSVSKVKETKYLPNHDCYIVLAKKPNKRNGLSLWGSSVLVSRKTDSQTSIIERLTEAVGKAILDVQKKFVEENLLKKI